MKPSVEKLRKAARAVYLACEESVAHDLSELMTWSANELEKKNPWHRTKEIPPPKDEMFIWARLNGPGKWSLGLAYWTVSGNYVGLSAQNLGDITHWKSIGDPP